MSTWTDFNDAEQQQSFELIPKGTAAKVRMTIKPGAYNDPEQGWDGGYATQSYETGSVYLAAEFVILEGEYAKRKVWSNIGLHSAKGPAWSNIGRSFVRAVLNSARGVRPQDNSPQAAAARRINGLGDLDGIDFVARIDIEKDGRGDMRNVIKVAIEPDHPQYAQLMGGAPVPANNGHAGVPAQAVPPRAAVATQATQRNAVTGKPTWAQ